ncbi:unnamed protein product [Staurois parvus]|uniref:Uncharacterized protein n=1 Tax=Staurois parvus TaxID=386267 RepID=A0ABN9D6N0_9NEOB|nr:unnamed protein product [Staurois parvus]
MDTDEAELMGTEQAALMGTDLTQVRLNQGQTDNSWGPRAIGDHGAPVSLPKLKKSL